MTNPGKQLTHMHDVSAKVAQVLQTRSRLALERFGERVRKASEPGVAGSTPNAMLAWQVAASFSQYAVDFAQRSVLFLDTLRQRGNNFIEHERAGLPPVLHFDYETIMDGRTLKRPVNYSLLRIVPPAGVTVDPTRRPYVIIDPRGGHGPGIGGFKDDSQVGVALHAGHPVYFVVFFPNPEPGQTLIDVCNAERQFVHHVRSLHPDAPKPAVVGNCQAGWAAMMLAASSPDDTGPIVIVGAPMSYWGGAWRDGEGDNPMRYAGGLLGGTWLSSLASDIGAGKFDGAYLVQNFENLNPANTFWNKYYNVFRNIDTEPPRFLEFERWWGGYFLMNREEIEWITQNLFVGNKVWSGAVKGTGGALDLRQIKVPIVLFASLGDNITPPQQAFNWVADVYGSTEEIKARGQVIVGLMHEDVGHLGIFVSGKVAKKEHAQIVSVLESIEALPPGLYGMRITEHKGNGGKPSYDVTFEELRLEDITARLNRFKRDDERPFKAVSAVSEFNQRAYELFGRPLVNALSNEYVATLSRQFHPLRFQRWSFSDLNPALGWLAPAAQAVKSNRQALDDNHPARKAEGAVSEVINASLDYYRDLRDALSEATFFQIYGNLYAVYLSDEAEAETAAPPVNARELPFVRDALASIEKGGYAEALGRVAFLMAHKDEPLPLSRLQLAHDLIKVYHDLLPQLPPDELRRIGGEQEIIARYEPQKAIDTLPVLLADRKDRERLLTLLARVLADPRVQSIEPSEAQRATLARIRSVLGAATPARRSTGGNGAARVARPKKRSSPPVEVAKP
jgi:pimeloyl-ACP methyl ester carboxylesterase